MHSLSELLSIVENIFLHFDTVRMTDSRSHTPNRNSIQQIKQQNMFNTCKPSDYLKQIANIETSKGSPHQNLQTGDDKTQQKQ